MDKDEMKMIEDIMTIIVRHHSGLGCDVLCDGDQCENCYLTAKDLYYAKYRKVGEDEIVVKKCEIGMLKKTISYLEMEKAQLNKQLEQAEQEMAREILQEVVNAWNTGNLNQRELAYICTKYGIELE